jgi:hypothetical protein
MKKLQLIVLFMGITWGSVAQTVNYKVIKDEPIEPKVSVNLDIFNIDINTKIKRLQVDNISFNLGTFGHVMPVNFAGVDFNIHKSWLVAGKLGFKEYPGNFELNLGGFFFFTNRTVTKLKTRVVLKSSSSTYNNKTVTTTTFIEMPAQKQKRFGVRGGIYQKSGPFNFEDFSDDPNDNFDPPPPFEYAKYFSFGFYGGLLWRNITNITIETDQYGKCGTSGGTDVYLEAMVIPVNKFTALDPLYTGPKDATALIKGVGSEAPVGFRIGFKKYQVEKKAITGKKFGRAGIAEFGYRPYIGWFASAGVAITLVKSTKPMSFGKKKADSLN